MLATLIVNSLDDDITIDNGDLLLREAIDYVNGRIPGSLDTESDGVVHIDESENLLGYNDIILFDPSLVALGATITLDNNLGHLQLEQTVTIDATALLNGITIDADGSSRVFYIDNPGPDENDFYNITLAGLTITGGDTTEDIESYDGGGILFQIDSSDYSFSILESVVKENNAHNNYGSGGGISVIASKYNYILEFNMVNSIVQDNTANCGGGVYIYYPNVDVEGSVTIEGCTLLGNTATGNDTNEFGSSGGGGLFARQEKGELTISESTFQGSNESGGSGANYGGGGIHVELGNEDHATLRLENSTVSGNIATASNGGGVWVNAKYGTFECIQNTVSDNSALFGAGGGMWLGSFYGDDTAVVSKIDHTTITENHSPNGGGLYAESASGMTTTLSHTIVSGNDDGDEEPDNDPNNIAGAVDRVNSWYNFLGSSSANRPPVGDLENGPYNIYSDNPNLRALGYYGGPTQTHLPYSDSEVIDAGDTTAVAGQGDIPLYDQRGAPYNRVIGGDIDIGAVEYNSDDNPSGPPTIVDIIISSSKMLHDPYSFAAADDSEDGPVVGSGKQLRTVPVGGADTVSIVFSEAVNITGDDVDIIGLRTANEPDLDNFEYEPTTFTVTCLFENWRVLGDQYVLSVADDNVTDMHSDHLDGEWTNPAALSTEGTTKTFPSGNGVEHGSFSFIFSVMPGDATLDLKVDGLDLAILAANFNTQTNVYVDADFNGDGKVDGLDLADMAPNFNLNWQELWILADFDGNLVVDDDDIEVIENHMGTGTTWEEGDLDDDGDVDAVDQAIAELFQELFQDLDLVIVD